MEKKAEDKKTKSYWMSLGHILVVANYVYRRLTQFRWNTKNHWNDSIFVVSRPVTPSRLWIAASDWWTCVWVWFIAEEKYKPNREVTSKREWIELHDQTIESQVQSIAVLSSYFPLHSYSLVDLFEHLRNANVQMNEHKKKQGKKW